MEREKLKSMLLILLVISSLLLTLAIWNHQPNFELTGNVEDLVDPQIESGHRLTRSDVLKPIYVVMHNESYEKPIGLANKPQEQVLFEKVSDYALYNFASFNLDEDWWRDYDNRIEIIFATELPSTSIYDIFDIDQDVSIPSGEFSRIEIIFDHDGYHLIFRNDYDNRVIGANLQNYTEETRRLDDFFKNEETVDYVVYRSSRDTNIYLPVEFNPNVLLFSYMDIPIDSFRNFLFPTPSIVRSSRTADGNSVLIDGTRELIVDSNRMSYTNQTNVEKMTDSEINTYDLFDQVQNFVNAHNGFTFEESFSYFLSRLEVTPQTNRVEYTLSYNGIPIFFDPQISNIYVSWHNQEVYQYRHPLITLLEQRGMTREATNLIDTSSVIEILSRDGYQRSAVYDVMVGYRVREQTGGQGQVFELIPTWYVKGVSGWNPLVIPPEYTGGDQGAMGAN